MRTLRGLIQIVITPFNGEGALDIRSLERLTADAVESGASALTVLGVSSEAALLSEDERRSVVTVVNNVVGGELPIVIGITSDEEGLVTQRAREAQEAGAAAIMLAPPVAGVAVERYTAAEDAAPGLPLILQDLPLLGHPKLSAADIAEIARAAPAITAAYHEDAPTPPKIAELATLAPDLDQVGGLGGLWLPWELRAGATAVMTGFAVPAPLAGVVREALAGNWERSDALHARLLPAIVWEAQPVIGLAHRKAMLVERGVIATPVVRVPTPPLPHAAQEAATLWRALERLDVAAAPNAEERGIGGR